MSYNMIYSSNIEPMKTSTELSNIQPTNNKWFEVILLKKTMQDTKARR